MKKRSQYAAQFSWKQRNKKIERMLEEHFPGFSSSCGPVPKIPTYSASSFSLEIYPRIFPSLAANLRESISVSYIRRTTSRNRISGCHTPFAGWKTRIFSSVHLLCLLPLFQNPDKSHISLCDGYVDKRLRITRVRHFNNNIISLRINQTAFQKLIRLEYFHVRPYIRT